MKFYEFGKEKEKSLMLAHGNASTWEQSFGKVIPLLSETYHVIAVGMDGLDPAEDSEYISCEDEAEKMEEYILNHLGGHIDAIYAASLGCGPALLIYFNGRVKVGYIILDGAANLTMGPLAKPFSRFAAKMAYKIARGDFNKMMMKMAGGVTQEMINEFMYTGATLNTLQNSCYAGCVLYPKLPKRVCTDVWLACWYGSKELMVPAGARELRKRFPKMNEKIFKGYAHGEILQHPEQLRDEIDGFLSHKAEMRASKTVVDCTTGDGNKNVLKVAAICIAVLSAVLIWAKKIKYT